MAPTKPLSQKRFSSNFPLVSLLILIAAFALLWKLGTGSLAAWDEAIYAQVSKEILRSGDWLTLHWEYQPWFEKPPLFMWITALFYRLFGVSEFWARVPSALSGIALIGVTYLIGKYTYGKWVGFLAAVILLTCYHFLSFSRFGTMDVMLTLFTYLTLYAYLRLNNENQKWWHLVWSSCALALMVKGAGGIIAPAAIVLALVFDKRFSAAIRSRRPWYIVPLYPALAILIGVFISNLYRDCQSRPIYRRTVTAACAALIIVGGLYSFVSLYFNHKPEEPIAKLSRLAQSTNPDDKDSLVLLSGVEPFYAQVSLFYSNRPIQQTYTSSEHDSEDAKRYVNYENLAEEARASAKRIILRKEDIPRLSVDYDIHVLGEDGPLAYATIRRKV